MANVCFIFGTVLIFFTIRMTRQARVAVILIATHFVMILIRLTRGMTCQAGEYCVVVRVGMTIHALIPFAFVFSIVDREVQVVMIER
jgi:hypothetical protein